jgi:hypothetical protein
MIETLPWYIPATILFVNAMFFTYWMVNLPVALRRTGAHNPGRIVSIIAAALLVWLALQATLAFRGFYLDQSLSFLLGIGPPLTAIAIFFAWRRSRQVLDAIPMTSLTYIHTLRFLVELVVYGLFVYGQTPRLMTFLGRNPDILIGLTAPIIGYVCFTRKIASWRIALAWHVAGLALLANVATLFVFSVPSPLKFFDVEQPNVGFFYFPFIWAPTHGVPTVIFSHCIAIRQLIVGARRGPGEKAIRTWDVAGR